MAKRELGEEPLAHGVGLHQRRGILRRERYLAVVRGDLSGLDDESERVGVHSHSAKGSLARILIAKSAGRRGEIAMQTAGSGTNSPSTAILATVPVTASGHPGNLGLYGLG